MGAKDYLRFILPGIRRIAVNSDVSCRIRTAVIFSSAGEKENFARR